MTAIKLNRADLDLWQPPVRAIAGWCFSASANFTARTWRDTRLMPADMRRRANHIRESTKCVAICN
nr:hypothetical protein [uncultured Rhodopila sp.]